MATSKKAKKDKQRPVEPFDTAYQTYLEKARELADEAFRAYLSAAKKAWMEADLEELDPTDLVVIGLQALAVSAAANPQTAAAQGSPYPGTPAYSAPAAPASPFLAAPASPFLAAPASPFLAAPASPFLAAPASPFLAAPASPFLAAPASPFLAAPGSST